MQAERDALRDLVLPRVNEFAAKFGRAVEIIDLRWGVDTSMVTEEEQNKKVLRTCLDEIERSRPFFLGLIGDRYGWTPPRPYMEAVLDAAQFSPGDPGMSVTALEIEYGALRAGTPPTCLFYFRESPDYTAMRTELRSVYLDDAESRAKLAAMKEEICARFGPSTRCYAAEVSENGLSVSKGWADMVSADITGKLREEWGEPPDAPLDWKEQERDIQDDYRESQTAHFAGRTAAVGDLAGFCLGEAAAPQILMVRGEAGSGKSGLLCRAMEEVEGKCLLLPFCCGISPRSSLVENMLRYFVALLCRQLALEDDSEGITKFQDLKDRFVCLLAAACAKTRVVVVADALDQLFGSEEAHRMLWISGKLPENFRLLCSIVDGPEAEAVTQLGGAVRPVPAISREDGAAIIRGIAALRHKQIGSTVVEHILEKQAPDGVQAAQNPLYLSLITQDMAMMDRYEMDAVQRHVDGGFSQPEALAKLMRHRIDETPGDTEGAYLAVLGRLEKLIGRDFVRGVCGLIAVSRSGLRDSDLEGASKELGIEYNPADFSWLRQMLRGHVAQGDMQQWDYSHQSLRRALRKGRAEELKRLNNGLAEHFLKTMEKDDFAAREIMHHLCMADRPDVAAAVMARYYDTRRKTLARGLADIYTEHETGAEFLLAVPSRAGSVDKKERWRVARMINICLPLLPENTTPFCAGLMLSTLSMLKGSEDANALWVTGLFEIDLGKACMETGKRYEAGTHFQRALSIREQLYERQGTTYALGELSWSYAHMGWYLALLMRGDEAGVYYRKELEARAKIFEQESTTEALRDLSISYMHMGDHMKYSSQDREAMGYYEKAHEALESIYEKTGTLGALRDLAVSYARMGRILGSMGRKEESLEYYDKSIAAASRVYEMTGAQKDLTILMTPYQHMGDSLIGLNRIKEAQEHYMKALGVLEQIHGKSGNVFVLQDLSILLKYMGLTLDMLGRKEEAVECWLKALDWHEQEYMRTDTDRALHNLSELYRFLRTSMKPLGRMEEAWNYISKEIVVWELRCEQTGKWGTLLSLSELYGQAGVHLVDMGRVEEANEYYQKAHAAAERVYELSNSAEAFWALANSYVHGGDKLRSRGKTEEADEHYRRSLALADRAYEQTGAYEKYTLNISSKAFRGMGDHLASLGYQERAGEYYAKSQDASEKLAREIKGHQS